MRGWEDEAALVAACRSGDDRAWAALYEAYAPRVARFLRRVCGADADVEDLVQQVFVTCFGSIGRFRGDAALLTWLFGVAANVARKDRRSAARRRRREDAFDAHRTAIGAGAGGDIASRVAARDTFAVVERALDTLKTPQRVAWVMVELEGLSSEDVARATGARPSTVRARLQVARERVRRAVERRERAARRTPAAGPEVVIR